MVRLREITEADLEAEEADADNAEVEESFFKF